MTTIGTINTKDTTQIYITYFLQLGCILGDSKYHYI